MGRCDVKIKNPYFQKLSLNIPVNMQAVASDQVAYHTLQAHVPTLLFVKYKDEVVDRGGLNFGDLYNQIAQA